MDNHAMWRMLLNEEETPSPPHPGHLAYRLVFFFWGGGGGGGGGLHQFTNPTRVLLLWVLQLFSSVLHLP